MADNRGIPEEDPVSVVPRSVAIIMDGNGRWAQARGLPRMEGHRAGAEAVDRITEAAAREGVRHLTLYAFSTENWQRPKREVSMLWRLLVRDLRRRVPKCLRQDIRITSIGRRDRMPSAAVRELSRVEQETAHCKRMTLCLALDYGGLWDLTELAERVRVMEREGKLPPGALDQDTVYRLLPSGSVPPTDLLIRTGGDSRVSNFLPVQLTYAELLFPAKLWPDFDEPDLMEAFRVFAGKHRRFGRIEEGAAAPAGQEPS